MAATSRWVSYVGYLAPIAFVLLIVQYLLGLWTNLYAPAVFTSNSSSPALDWHYNIGYTLFVLSVVVLILAGISKQIRLIAPSLVLLVSILLAGLFGGAFVGSNPNNAVDSFGMGVMFLFALLSSLGLVFQTWGRTMMTARHDAMAPTGPQSS